MNNINISNISFQEALQFVDESIKEKNDRDKNKQGSILRPLNNTQTAIFKEIWLDDAITYREIADRINLSNEGVRSAAKGMLVILNEVIPTYAKIERKNLKSLITQRIVNKRTQGDRASANFEINQDIPTQNPAKIKQLQFPKGPLPLESDFYLKRPLIESKCYSEIRQKGGLVRIKAPKEMGKTTLITRIRQNAKQEGACIVYLNLEQITLNSLLDSNSFFKYFCANVSDRLNYSNQLNISLENIQKWTSDLGVNTSVTNYFQRDILPKVAKSLVLIIDQFDLIFLKPEIATTFFSILRSLHEEAKTGDDDNSEKIRIVLSYSTEAYISYNVNQSPFNVGLPINLPEFSPSEILDLAQRYSVQLSQEQFEDLKNAIGGHPYLVQLALYHLATSQINFSGLLTTAHTDRGIYSSHLNRHLNNLEENPELKADLIQLLKTTSPVLLNDYVNQFKLYSMGLIQLEGNKVILRCEIYRRYFSEKLLN